MQLAEFNLGRLAVPLDDPSFQSYLDAVGQVQSQGDTAAGFVWRDQYFATDDPNPFGSEMLATISVWTSIDALRAFTYSGLHRDMFRRRHEWFESHHEPRMVLWWVPDGHRPSPEESLARLDHLVAHGPTEHAFTFARSFGPVDDAP